MYWRLPASLQHPIVLVGVALVCAFLVPGLFRLESDNSPQAFFVRGKPEVARYRSFLATFGSDQAVRLVVRGSGLWTSRGLDWLAETEQGAARIPGVVAANGLYFHHREAGWPPKDGEAFRVRVRDNALDRSAGFVDPAASMATVFIVLEAGAETATTLAALEALAATAPPDLDTVLVGMPLLDRSLDRSSEAIAKRYFPFLLGFSILLLAVCFRNLGGLLIPLLFVGLCELLVLAPMGYRGVTLNLILSLLPPLVFVIALATALHLLLRFRAVRARHPSPGAACIATYRETGWAVLWTGITTMIGFASLATSPVGPVRSLGLWVGLGLGLMTLAAFVVYPALLVTTSGQERPRTYAYERWARRLGWRCSRWACHRRRPVLLIAAGLGLFAIAGLSRIEIESNALRYLEPTHPVRAGIETLEQNDIGLAALELLVTAPDAPFSAAADLVRTAELAARLEQEPLVYGVLSAGTVLNDAAGRVPTPLGMAPQGKLQMVLEAMSRQEEGRRALDVFLSPDRHSARLTLFVRTVGFDRITPIIGRIRDAAAAAFPRAQVEVTGQYPLLLATQQHLISTLILSLTITVLCVALILRVLLPGTRFTVLALLPNLWPVLGVLGLMGWMAVPLDIATVMVASIALGLAVDDTIHTLGHFQSLAARHPPRRAVVHTLARTTPAYLLTGAILVAGFGICGFSDFAPLRRFGFLSASAITMAVLGDLLLLPALLSMTPARSLKGLRKRATDTASA